MPLFGCCLDLFFSVSRKASTTSLDGPEISGSSVPFTSLVSASFVEPGSVLLVPFVEPASSSSRTRS